MTAQTLNARDLHFADLAITAASNDPRNVKVGAVLVRDNQIVGRPAWGAMIARGDHAEQTLLDLILPSEPVQGATLYVTLEPCMRSRHWTASRKYQTCAEIIVDRGIQRVVIGMPDPDRRIHARGIELLVKEGITIDCFPDDRRQQCERLNLGWMEDKKREWTYSDMFFAVEAGAAKIIRPYQGLKVGYALTLQQTPVPDKRWALPDVRVEATEERWDLDPKRKSDYESYVARHPRRFAKRREDLCHMLLRNPVSFSDAPEMILEVGITKYTFAQFYRDVVISNGERVFGPDEEDEEKARLIARLVKADGRADFPHSLCAHIIITTSDQYILRTQRSPKVDYHPHSWSCSIEEQLSTRDLGRPPEEVVESWIGRALWEELALPPKYWDQADVSVMSVFLEGDILNIAVCVIAALRIARDELNEIIRTYPKTDEEFVAWDYLPYRDDVLVSEIIWPRVPYHPTSRYRLMMALLKKNGLPR